MTETPPLSAVDAAVRASWSIETCDPIDRHEWSPANPARGQCGSGAGAGASSANVALGVGVTVEEPVVLRLLARRAGVVLLDPDPVDMGRWTVRRYDVCRAFGQYRRLDCETHGAPRDRS